MTDMSKVITDLKHELRMSNRQLADKLGVSMYTVQAWCTGRRSPSKTMVTHINNTFDVTKGKEKQMSQPQPTRPVSKSNEQLLIDLQKEKIDTLLEQVDKYKTLLQNPAEGKRFDELTYDFRTEVEIKFSLSGVKRRMNTISNGYKKIAHYLGMDEKKLLDLYAPKIWYPMNDHPINQILEESNLKKIQSMTKTLPERFETLKNVVGDHYVSEMIIYEYKGKRLMSWVHCKVHWGLKVVVDCKSQIIYE